MKKHRVLLLVDHRLVPPILELGMYPSEEELERAIWRTEFYVWDGLIRAGHDVKIVPMDGDLSVIEKARESFNATVAFNLLEEFNYNSKLDHGIVSYLEMIQLPYTGCNPKGLILAKDKSLAKKVLAHHKICTPKFEVVRKGKRFKRPSDMEFPLFVKTLDQEGSVGISQKSIVHDEKALQDRVSYIHDKIDSDALVESFIDGKDIYVSVMGNESLRVFPTLEMRYEKESAGLYQIASDKAKWNPEFRERHGVDVFFTNFNEILNERIEKVSKEIYRILNLSGYARLDLRLTDEGDIYFIEANPNPDIARVDEFAYSAEKAGLPYEELLNKMLSQAISHQQKQAA